MIAFIISTPTKLKSINYSFVLFNVSQDRMYEISDGDDWYNLIYDIEKEFSVYADNSFLNIHDIEVCSFMMLDITMHQIDDRLGVDEVSNIDIMFKVLDYFSNKSINAINCEITSGLPTEDHAVYAAVDMIHGLCNE